MPVLWNEVNAAASGGTELMLRALESRLDPALMEQVQIVPARGGGDVSRLDPNLIRILWCQDLAGDAMTSFLEKEGWRYYHKIVFVSHHQQQSFIGRYSIPHHRCVVIKNAIDPLEKAEPYSSGPVRLIYTPTPHRGLDVLVSVFSKIAETDPDVTLDVFSSFKLYGWAERDKQFSTLFKACEDHPQINYHGTATNQEVRDAVSASHIFAYPSTWMETSCVCLIEALSAGLLCVHSNLGALPETAADMTMMYPFDERKGQHAGVFHAVLTAAIDEVRSGRFNGATQKSLVDATYSWDRRLVQWEALIKSMLGEPRDIPGQTFTYTIG